MGAYGGTAYASMKQLRWLDGDISRDGLVDMIDIAILAENWLRYEPPTSNKPPAVTITGPKEGAHVELDSASPIEIKAYARDTDGMVVKVEFFADGTKIGEDDNGSDGWKILWSDWPEHGVGAHSLTAKATDDDGGSAFSASVRMIVSYPGPRF
jgi:hypothetical protein